MLSRLLSLFVKHRHQQLYRQEDVEAPFSSNREALFELEQFNALKDTADRPPNPSIHCGPCNYQSPGPQAVSTPGSNGEEEVCAPFGPQCTSDGTGLITPQPRRERTMDAEMFAKRLRARLAGPLEDVCNEIEQMKELDKNLRELDAKRDRTRGFDTYAAYLRAQEDNVSKRLKERTITCENSFVPIKTHLPVKMVTAVPPIERIKTEGYVSTFHRLSGKLDVRTAICPIWTFLVVLLAMFVLTLYMAGHRAHHLATHAPRECSKIL